MTPYIWISDKLKSDYLKNKKSFQSKINKHFFLFKKYSFLDIENKLVNM